MRWMIVLMLSALPAQAADKALILNDAQQGALRQALDSAIRANGLSQASRNAIVLSDMLDAAGVVTEHKEAPATPPVAPEQPKDTAQ